MSADARARGRIRWLTGNCGGAGGSSVARALAVRHPELVVVDTDALTADHARRADPASAPALARFAAATLDERWLGGTPAEMLESFHWYRGEAFDLILADVAALPADRPVLVEGFRLLTALVAPLLDEPGHGLWLLPTPASRRRAFTERGSLDDVAGRTSDPPRALANLLERDALFTDRLRAGAHAFGTVSVVQSRVRIDRILTLDCTTEAWRGGLRARGALDGGRARV